MNKVCTDVKQSRKLIELGIDVETADMHYMYRHWEIDKNTIGSQSDASIGFDLNFFYGEDNGKTHHYIPCWSLTALLSVIPYPSLHKTFSGWRCDSYDKEGKTFRLGESADNQIDACYEMIIRLHELKLL